MNVYERDSANFKLLNCPNQILLISYLKYLNDEFHINKLTVTNSGLSFIFPPKIDVIAESWMFFPELLSC